MTEDNPFKAETSTRLRRALSAKNNAATANALFGDFVDTHSDYFRSLKDSLQQTDMDVLFRTYVSEMLLFTSAAVVLGSSAGLLYSVVQGFGLVQSLQYIVGTPISLGLVVFGLMYLYPGSRAKSRSENIDDNIPFAINHMSAISSSGVPPDSMFELLEQFEEYGEIQNEAEAITRRVNIFGEDATTAITEVADRTPNDRFADFLYGMVSTIETGGDLHEYVEDQADEQLFKYNIRKEKEIDRISTYASFYTALLIAAPVFLVVILSIINLLQSRIGGFTVRNLMFLGIHVVIPVVNTMFIIFLVVKTD
jgi:Archaeal flagella assembly protein J|nr:MAG: archaeal flagella assembly protein J [Candidatus Nanosalinarum sp. J07AB56]